MTDALGTLTAAILVGGEGRRLRPVVSDRPKPLAEVNGRPFLFYLLDQLAAAGIRDVVLCVGYQAEQVQATIGERYGPLSIRYSSESSPLGTGGAIRNGLNLYRSDPVLILNGDSYVAVDFRAFYRYAHRRRAAAALVAVWTHDSRRYGTLELDAEDRVLAFREKSNDEKRGGWINAGVYLLAREKIAGIPAARAVSIEREVFPEWTGKDLYAFRCNGTFIDIGTPDAYRAAAEFFQRQQNRSERSVDHVRGDSDR